MKTPGRGLLSASLGMPNDVETVRDFGNPYLVKDSGSGTGC